MYTLLSGPTFFPDLWCIPFSLFSQEKGIHHSFFCSATLGSGDRPRKEGFHGGGVYSFSSARVPRRGMGVRTGLLSCFRALCAFLNPFEPRKLPLRASQRGPLRGPNPLRAFGGFVPISGSPSLFFNMGCDVDSDSGRMTQRKTCHGPYRLK